MTAFRARGLVILFSLAFWMSPSLALAELVMGGAAELNRDAARSQNNFCESVVNSESCTEFRSRRPDLQGQFLRCDAGVGAVAVARSCGQGVWNSVKETFAIFEAPKLSPLGKTFTEYQESCFADPTCREKAYRRGVSGRKVTVAEMSKIQKVPKEHRLQVQPFYYGLLEQLRSMKDKELRLIASGVDPASPNGIKAMREDFPLWKPDYRALYTPEGWVESATKTVNAIVARMQELGIELKCLDNASVAEMLCFGAGFVVDPAVALKMVTTLPKAAKVISGLLQANGKIKSATLIGLEKKWGRSLSVEELNAIDKAHKIGALEKGKNGEAAGLGNYTVGQLRRKYLALENHFLADEIRDLMENNVVGLTPREQALLRAEQIRKENAKANKEKPAPVQKVVSDPPPTSAITDATFESLEKTEKSVLELKQQLGGFNPEVSRIPEFQNLQKHVADLQKQQDELLGTWNAQSGQSTRETQTQIHYLQNRIDKSKAEIELWKKRESTTDWQGIRETPTAVLPNRIYKVKTDRGETLSVSFNDRVVREMLWEGPDEIRNRAGRTSIEAVARGYQPQHNSNGLNLISLDGDKFVKIHIVGKSVGAYRVYGMERNGVIHFVNWEHESLHDSRYLRRAFENTKRAFGP